LEVVLGGEVSEIGASSDLFNLPSPGYYYWNASAVAPANAPAPQGSFVDYRTFKNIKTLTVYNNSGAIYTNTYWNEWKGWIRADNFNCNTPADLASLLGVKETVSLSSGTDLNDIKDSTKIYTCSSATIASALVNCPVSVGFKMYVISVNTADISNAPRVAQVIIANSENGDVYIRKLLGSTISNWYLHSGTVV
jgi:hypothetical protein